MTAYAKVGVCMEFLNAIKSDPFVPLMCVRSCNTFQALMVGGHWVHKDKITNKIS